MGEVVLVGRFIKIVKDKKGFTGLEAAIVLIAFVTVAAVFSYVMLGAGFFTAQKGKQSVDTGVKQASSSLELDGQYIYLEANKTGSDGDVKKIFFYVTLSAGGTPIDLDKTVLAIRYQDKYGQIPFGTMNKQDNNTTVIYNINRSAIDPKTGEYNETNETGYLLWWYEGIVYTDSGNTFDNLLEKNEKYKIKINLTQINATNDYKYPLPKTNDYLTIELKPSIGAPLIINKQIPPSLTKLTWV